MTVVESRTNIGRNPPLATRSPGNASYSTGIAFYRERGRKAPHLPRGIVAVRETRWLMGKTIDIEGCLVPASLSCIKSRDLDNFMTLKYSEYRKIFAKKKEKIEFFESLLAVFDRFVPCLLEER